MNSQKIRLLILLLVAVCLLGGCRFPFAFPTEHFVNPNNSAATPNSVPTQPRRDADIDIGALHALLIGVRYDPHCALGEVRQWTDDSVYDAIYGKLLWDGYEYSETSYLHKHGLTHTFQDGQLAFDLKDIQKITRDAFDRDFPLQTGDRDIFVSGDKVLISEAIGESETLFVQDAAWQGNRIVAVGTAVYHNNVDSVFQGYFEAIFKPDPSGIYGYTLVSLREIRSSQDFSNLTATASSELKETTKIHHAGNVLDRSLRTAWTEGVSGVGVNQWIKLETRDGSTMDLAAIGFALGYQKSEDLLKKNGAPTRILIECEDGYRQEWQFSDYYYDDTVLLDRPVSTSWVKITILDANAGTQYKDTCISEITLYGTALTK